MPVTERLMDPGSFNMRFREDTPIEVLERLYGRNNERFLSHLVFTDVDLGELWADNTADLLAVSRYTGVIRGANDGGLEVTGSGLEFWLGDEDGKGPMYLTAIELLDAELDEWMDELLPAGYTIELGTVYPPTVANDTLSFDLIYKTPRFSIDFISRFFQVEWRVNPDGTLDIGPVEDLFNVHEAIVTRLIEDDIAGKTGVRAVPNWSADMEDYASTVIGVVPSFNLGGVAISTVSQASIPYLDLRGEEVNIIKRIDLDEILVDDADNFTEEELDRSLFTDRVTIDTESFVFPAEVKPGDTIQVWDPHNRNLQDSSVDYVDYGGVLIQPRSVRVYANTWPIEYGMGVFHHYHVAGGGVRIDRLTPYIEWEDGRAGSVVPPPEREVLRPDELIPDFVL